MNAHNNPSRLWIIHLAEALSKRVERHVRYWPAAQKDGLGDQWSRSTDSIGDNIAEGYARIHLKERLHFLSIAHGSLEEALGQVRRARDRQLIDPMEASIMMNLYLKLLKGIKSFVVSEKNENVGSLK